jgi:capsid protein
MEAERVPAEFVLHWFKMRRPGQHRGVPEISSTLNLGAAARRWRESTLSAADNIAEFAIFLKTMFQPDEMDQVSAMSTMDIQRRMMTALPMGWEAFQPKAEQPTATFESFNKELIREQARPKNMPLNKAACDSSSYNFASGRLDHATYYGSLDIDRADCDDLALDRLFTTWFDFAIISYGWIGGDPIAVSDAVRSHTWDWPKHQVADQQSEASANQVNLTTGATDWHRVTAESGLDPEDELVKQADFYGITPDQMRTITMIRNMPQHVIPYAVELIARGELLPEPEPQTAPVAVAQGDEDAE